MKNELNTGDHVAVVKVDKTRPGTSRAMVGLWGRTRDDHRIDLDKIGRLGRDFGRRGAVRKEQS